MAFIDTIPARWATGETFEMYERQQRHYGYVPSYATVFSHRPEVIRRWAELLAAIKRPMGKRRFELATFAAAHELKSTLCTLAHGKALLEFFSAADVIALARGETPPSITPAEAALMRFARAVARDASSITAGDVAQLKTNGFSDAEVFDIAAVAAGRAFFTKVIESLGAASDGPLEALDPELRAALAVGRPIQFAEPDRLDEPEFRAAG
ncbi:MAG: peroxidase [Gammaproteobacteria bacterium]|nr:peroxidase [Gammaproteobacteria bacterium]